MSLVAFLNIIVGIVLIFFSVPIALLCIVAGVLRVKSGGIRMRMIFAKSRLVEDGLRNA